MNRRHFIASGLVVAAGSAVASITPLQGPVRRASINRPTLIQQQCPLWCWAASISMIFTAHGHDVPQQNIVAQTFGATYCTSSGNPVTIARDLSRGWTDTNGQDFYSQVVAAYDAWNGVNTLNNGFIVAQLANNNPLLYCNQHHAMVLVSVDFIQTPIGPNIVGASVMDPWPGAMGFHPLSPSELTAVQLGGQMTFLAAVELS